MPILPLRLRPCELPTGVYVRDRTCLWLVQAVVPFTTSVLLYLRAKAPGIVSSVRLVLVPHNTEFEVAL